MTAERQSGDSREVLEQDPRWGEGDFCRALLLLLPVQDVVNVLLPHVKAIALSDGGLQQDADGQRQCICTQKA